ncbi:MULTISPECIES: twin-arginine translocase subunit TatC [Persicobacter]|uniref:Sec-independent protein translocase protein TatC n=1 Tax=Persicobacter diffluens TaxID=981 RepID=A0AAN4W0Z0_9BACT|nr:twin-arginine translocase subunit TatC [Persicobacter sp. CCB-QB2]GJM62312.1 Sec-independent protein translocase protein TatC [Persicobacter diffluens]
MSIKQEQDMSFLDHLEELRWHLIRAFASIFVFSIIAFLSKNILFHHIILAPSRSDFWTYRMFCELGQYLTGSDAFCIEELPFILQSRQVTGQFMMHVQSSFVVGLIFAFPYAFWEIWRFVAPGLYDEERNAARGAVFFVSLLFALGVMFGYFMVLPISLNFLSNYQLDPTIQNEFDIISYIGTVTMVVLACALMFQLPVVIYFLTKAGIVTPAILEAYRKHAFVAFLVVSAIITPPDVVSQILLSIPLVVLYEISIVIAKRIQKREQSEELVVSKKEPTTYDGPLDQMPD